MLIRHLDMLSPDSLSLFASSFSSLSFATDEIRDQLEELLQMIRFGDPEQPAEKCDHLNQLVEFCKRVPHLVMMTTSSPSSAASPSSSSMSNLAADVAALDSHKPMLAMYASSV
jgi:hypothetical protein